MYVNICLLNLKNSGFGITALCHSKTCLALTLCPSITQHIAHCPSFTHFHSLRGVTKKWYLIILFNIWMTSIISYMILKVFSEDLYKIMFYECLGHHIKVLEKYSNWIFYILTYILMTIVWYYALCPQMLWGA